MAYQSRHSGAEIDRAIDLIYEAVEKEGVSSNQLIPVTADDWESLSSDKLYGYRFTAVLDDTFVTSNRFPMVYFVGSDGMVFDLPITFMSQGNLYMAFVFSNTQIEGTLVICSTGGQMPIA